MYERDVPTPRMQVLVDLDAATRAIAAPERLRTQRLPRHAGPRLHTGRSGCACDFAAGQHATNRLARCTVWSAKARVRWIDASQDSSASSARALRVSPPLPCSIDSRFSLWVRRTRSELAHRSGDARARRNPHDSQVGRQPARDVARPTSDWGAGRCTGRAEDRHAIRDRRRRHTVRCARTSRGDSPPLGGDAGLLASLERRLAARSHAVLVVANPKSDPDSNPPVAQEPRLYRLREHHVAEERHRDVRPVERRQRGESEVAAERRER
jgi:hypothetical protein